MTTHSHDTPGSEIPLDPGPPAISLEDLLRFVTVGKAGGMPSDLRQYWTRGAGAAKINWGGSGSMDRCKTAMAGHVPPGYDLGGVCANLHRVATGKWPAEKHG